jgi:hypothetical protein
MIGFITITVDCNSSHIELLLDNESLTVFLLVLGMVSSLLLLSTSDSFLLSLSLSFSLMLRPTVSRPLGLGIKHPFGAYDQILLLLDSCGFVDVGRSL